MKKSVNSRRKSHEHANDSSFNISDRTRATVYMVNGDRYLGEWKDSVKDGKIAKFGMNELNNLKSVVGKGLYFSKKSGAIFQGEWKDDKRDGFGTLSVHPKAAMLSAKDKDAKAKKKSDSVIEELSNLFAQMSENHNLGVPNSVYIQGKLKKIYAGNWVNNMREGYGTSFEPDDATYEGQWKHNQKNGWGVRYYNDGCRYEGEWHQSKRHGQGMFIHGKGVISQIVVLTNDDSEWQSI